MAFVLDSTLELVSTLADVLSDGGKNVLISFCEARSYWLWMLVAPVVER